MISVDPDHLVSSSQLTYLQNLFQTRVSNFVQKAICIMSLLERIRYLAPSDQSWFNLYKPRAILMGLGQQFKPRSEAAKCSSPFA